MNKENIPPASIELLHAAGGEPSSSSIGSITVVAQQKKGGAPPFASQLVKGPRAPLTDITHLVLPVEVRDQ